VTPQLPWVEIEIDASGDDVRVTGRGCRGERPPPHLLGPAIRRDRLDAFARGVGRAAQAGAPLTPALLADAHALHDAVLRGELRDVVVRIAESSAAGRVLLVLMVRDAALQAIPWEAACRPGSAEGFFASSSRIAVARGVTSADAWAARPVRGAVRVLAIAPSRGEPGLAGLEDALAGSVDAGEVAWLDPIVGEQATPRRIFEALRRRARPHVVHFIGHGGVDAAGRPSLRLADDDGLDAGAYGAAGDEAWITAEAFARELGTAYGGDLRLAFLEACEGARPGALGSAAEIVARAGIDAALAFLWPVKSDAARACSRAFYRALTSAERDHGDVVASLTAARRALLVHGAEGLSPVVYLRAPGAVVFDFEGRATVTPAPPRREHRIRDARVAAILDAPFSLVFDDAQTSRAAITREARRLLEDRGDAACEEDESGDDGVIAACALLCGTSALGAVVQRALGPSLDAPVAPLALALAGAAGPGVHVSFAWTPHLERAIARSAPDRAVHVVMPARPASPTAPRIITRARGATSWTVSTSLPPDADRAADIVVLRIDGGFSPEEPPVFTTPMLTADDALDELAGEGGFGLPAWAASLASSLAQRPLLFAGVSAVDLRHRILLRWLFGLRPVAAGSIALVDRGGDPEEPLVWESGAAIASMGRIGVVHAHEDALVDAIDPRVERNGHADEDAESAK